MSTERVQAEYVVERTAQARFEEATRVAAEHGIVQAHDPLQALLEIAATAHAWHEVCKSMVGDLTQIRYQSGSAGEQTRAEVVLFERSMDRSARMHADIVRLGIEDRMARISTVQHAQVAAAIEAAVAELGRLFGFDPTDADVRGVIGRHLREVTG